MINFSEYLLLRKTAITWTECAQETMNRASLRCALQLLVKNSKVEQNEADLVFRVAIQYMPYNKYAISFPIFVLFADIFQTFYDFDAPVDVGSINFNEMLRHAAEQDKRYRITPEALRSIYNSIGQRAIKFETFVHALIL